MIKGESKQMNYKCVEQRLINEYIGDYITYGIEITDENIILDDVSCNRKTTEKITAILNAHQASIINFKEIVEDLIAA